MFSLQIHVLSIQSWATDSNSGEYVGRSKIKFFNCRPVLVILLEWELCGGNVGMGKLLREKLHSSFVQSVFCLKAACWVCSVIVQIKTVFSHYLHIFYILTYWDGTQFLHKSPEYLRLGMVLIVIFTKDARLCYFPSDCNHHQRFVPIESCHHAI